MSDDPAENAPIIIRAMCSSYYDVLSPNALWVGDKDPDYVFQWRLLRRIFPNSKIIVTHRNHDDVMASAHRMGWQHFDDERATEFELASKDVDGLHVMLEELNSDPIIHIKRIITYLGMDPMDYPLDAAVNQVLCGGRVS